MTTKYRIAEQVLLHLNKRGYDSDLSLQEIMLRIPQAVAYNLRQRYFISKQTDVEDLDGSVMVTFKNIEVEQNTDTLEYYVKLPATVTSFPYGLGISRVSPMKNPTYPYRPVTPGFLGLYDGLLSSNLEGSIGYYQENDKLFFVRMTGINNPEKVLVKMVNPIDGVEDDEPLNIPMDIQDEVIRYLVSVYLPTPIKDTTADNVDQA